MLSQSCLYLQFLDLPLQHSYLVGVILQTVVEAVDLLVLLAAMLLEVTLDSLKVVDSFLSHLQVLLDLPLSLLYISTYLPLTLQIILELK